MPGLKFQNFKSVQKRLKFNGQLLKALKEKAKVKVNQNWMKTVYYHGISWHFINFCEILLTLVKSHNFPLNYAKVRKTIVKMTLKIYQILAEFG